MGKKTKANRRRVVRAKKRALSQRAADEREFRARISRRNGTPAGAIVAWICTDPACEGIHHPAAAGQEAHPDRERPGATNAGPFSDPSQSKWEAAGGRHDTPRT